MVRARLKGGSLVVSIFVSVRSLERPVALSVICTVAFGMTPPFGSVTVPRIVPRFVPWANPSLKVHSMNTATRILVMNVRTIFISNSFTETNRIERTDLGRIEEPLFLGPDSISRGWLVNLAN